MAAPYLILHGYEGNDPGHWQTWLAGELRAAGAHVAYPALPDPFEPRLDAWLAALRAELSALAAPPVVVCHSLGCLLWLHHGAPEDAERAILVAPPSPEVSPPALASFFPAPLDVDLGPGALLVCADDDPWCPAGAAAVYGPLGLPVELVPGGGHLNTAAGYGVWPAMLGWCRSGAKKGIET